MYETDHPVPELTPEEACYPIPRPRPDPVRRIRRPFSRMGWALLTTGAVGLAASLILMGFAMVFGGPDLYDNSFLMWLITFFPIYGVGFPVGMLIIRGIPRERYVRKNLNLKEFLCLMLLCVPVTMAGSILGSILGSLLSFGQAVDPVADMTMALDPMSIFTLLVGAPVMEELLFRKMILDRAAVYGEVPAILFSAMAFGLFHGNVYQLFYTFGIGVLFGYVYQRTHRIADTMVMHSVLNFFGGVVAPLLVLHADEAALEAESLPQMLEALRSLTPLMIYETVLTVLGAAGLVLLVMNRKNFRIDPAAEEIPRGYRRKIMLQNPGVICFLVFSILETLMVLVQSI